jgi:hypothetical protein
MAAGKGNFAKKLKTLFALAVAGGATLGGPAYYHYGTVEQRELTVEKIDKKSLGIDPETRDQKYDIKIITNDGTITNDNSTLHFKFDSDDTLRKMKEGETYIITTYGARFDVPIIGRFYPNILSVEPVPAPDTVDIEVTSTDGQKVKLNVPREMADQIKVVSVTPAPPAPAPKPDAPKP